MHKRTILLIMLTAPLAASVGQAQVRIEAEAFSGTPFGVGRVTVSTGGEIRFKGALRPGQQRGGRAESVPR